MPSIGDKITIQIDDLSHDGAGVGRIDNLVIFIPGALPGEQIEAEIIEVRKNFGRGKLLSVLESSRSRITPPCPVYESCGGCQLQHLNYQAQLNHKKERVENALARIGNIEDISVNPVLEMEDPWRYRNKAQFHAAQIKGKLKLGYYRSGSRELISIEDCLLLPAHFTSLIKMLETELNKQGIAAYSPKTKTGVLKHVIVKQSETTGEMMVILITRLSLFPQGKSLAKKIMTENPCIKSVVHNINPNPKEILGKDFHQLAGSDRIKEKLGALEFLISPPAFFQVNTKQATHLCEKVVEYANLSGKETAFDLYCGTGTLSLWLAKDAKKVYGMETNPGAIEDVKANASLNKIGNVEFIAGQVEKTLPELLAKNIKPDLIVLDPPRQGVAISVLEEIAKVAPPSLIYVSCDPGTLARDLGILKDFGYKTLKIQPVDMFPQTGHVECCVLLYRKGYKVGEKGNKVTVEVGMNK